jgi:Na+/proline symporter
MTSAVHPLDAAIVVVYLATLAAVGVYFSRRQTSLDTFFRARQLSATKKLSSFGRDISTSGWRFR